jgi:hypothetical protein
MEGAWPELTISVVILHSRLTCPEFGHSTSEEMRTDSCMFFYECVRCRTLLRPRQEIVVCSAPSAP